MKHLLLISLICFSSCQHKSESRKSESVANSIELKENYVPVVGPSFEDFITDFGFNSDLQKSRIIFPIEYDSLDVKNYIKSESWRNDRLFVDLESITFISNGIAKKEESRDRVFTWINTQTGISKNYYFKNDSSEWHLVKISIIKEPIDQEKEDFYSFLCKFCKDSTFQKQRINITIDITYLDDDFNAITVTRNNKDWKPIGFYFKQDSLATTYYDFQRTLDDTNDRILDTKGNGNGISARLTFKRIGNKWVLIKFEDHST
jgi:hypothetical protein